MNYEYFRINGSVGLAYIGTDRFKKARLSLTFISPLDAATAPENSLVIPVSFLGTEGYADFRSVCRRAEELYASDISDFNMKLGGLQLTGYRAVMLDDSYVSEADRAKGVLLLDGVAELLSQLVRYPLTRGKDVETEKLNQINRIRSVGNDAFTYARLGLAEEMFAGERYGVSLTGTVGRVEAVTPEIIKERHAALMSSSPVEFFYCGSASAESVIAVIEKYFSGCFTGTAVNYESGAARTAGAVKHVEKTGEYRQGNLLLGFRTGTVLSDGGFYATELMNRIYGDGPTSKLFLNVREKRSLCYFCNSGYNEITGVITVGCGIDCADRDAAQDEILFRLEEMKQGNISDSELAEAKKSTENDCRSAEDHPEDYEDFGRTARLFGGPSTIGEFRDGIMSVTKDEIVAAARKMTLDTVFFLRGTLGEETADE